MSLEAIEKVTTVEQTMRERKAAMEAEAKQMVAEAERAGLALLAQVREEAAADGKLLLQKAEAQAAIQAAEIGQSAQAECDAMRKVAEGRLEEAAEFIIGRVVRN